MTAEEELYLKGRFECQWLQYERLVWKKARLWCAVNPGVAVEDLVQEGRLALWRTLLRHDGRPGFTEFFCTVMWRTMRDWVMYARCVIRTPRSAMKDVLNGGLQFVDLDERELGQLAAVREESSDVLMQEEGMTQRLLEAMEQLEAREHLVVLRRFFDGRKLREVADEMGVKHQWVSVLEQRALARLRRLLRRTEREGNNKQTSGQECPHH